MLLLPFAGMAYTLSSAGPPTPFVVPTVFAGVIGFLSNLAVAECHGLIMEVYDTSDLQPSITGRTPELRRGSGPDRIRANYSCFPRVSAAYAIVQTMAFLLAAASTGVGGVMERRIGAQAATGLVGGILLMLTGALVAVLWRWKTVPVIPSTLTSDDWQPVIIGHPSGRTRRMNILELGHLSRWTEIRRLNHLI